MTVPPARRKSSRVFWLAVVLILAAVPVAYFALLEEPPAPVPPPPPPPVAPAAKKRVALSLGEVSGDVQIRRPGGEWQAAQQGEVIEDDASVRTGEGASAVLVGAESYEVRLEPSTEVAVDEITDSISRLLLGNGMATARVSPGAKHVFEVRAAGSDAVARTQAGVFSVSNNGQGTVAVGTREGEVEFLGSGKLVIVRAGEQSIIRPGAGPTEPAPIPSSLLLKVKWPAANQLNTRKLVVSGEAEPGSQVRVGGKTAPVDAQGRFSVPLSLREGRNGISVQAVGVGGGTATDGRQVDVDTRVDKTRIDKNLWDK